MTMWSSCFNPVNGIESAHSLGSSLGSLPAPDTPMLSAHSLMSAQSSKSLQQLPPEALTSSDDGNNSPASEAGSGDDTTSQGSGPGLDADMSESPRADSKAQYAAEHGQPDCQLIGPGWKLWAHKQVLKGEHRLHNVLMFCWPAQSELVFEHPHVSASCERCRGLQQRDDLGWVDPHSSSWRHCTHCLMYASAMQQCSCAVQAVQLTSGLASALA